MKSLYQIFKLQKGMNDTLGVSNPEADNLYVGYYDADEVLSEFRPSPLKTELMLIIKPVKFLLVSAYCDFFYRPITLLLTKKYSKIKVQRKGVTIDKRIKDKTNQDLREGS